MKIKILPYRRGSNSVKLLKAALKNLGVRAKSLRLRGSRFKGGSLVNWGNSACHHAALNRDTSVARCKLATFRALEAAGVSIPRFTDSQETAQEWESNGRTILARTILNGNSGQGIEFGASHTAPLYVQFFRKLREYRVHVIGGNVALVQQKRKKHDAEPNAICNHKNGYVFAVKTVDQPREETVDNAIRAVSALGLDFGAVDIIETSNNCYVLEVNTAPGLSPQTAEIYAREFVKIFNGGE